MDCEKFEPLLLDELYEELDELTSAAVKRHVSGCAKCAAILNGMRSTRRAVTLPLEPVPAGLEDRILAAAKEAQKVVPIKGRFGRVVSIAGQWAMRPQTAMAAVFLLMIGTSAFLIRSKDYRSKDSAVSVTVAGAPAPQAQGAAPLTADPVDDPGAHGPAAPVIGQRPPMPVASAAVADNGPLDRLTGGNAKDDDSQAVGSLASEERAAPMVAAAPAATVAPNSISNAGGPSAGAPMADGMTQAPAGGMAKRAGGGGSGNDPYSLGAAAFQARNYAEATKQFDAAAKGGDRNAELWAAESVREGQGCAMAVGRYDALANKAAGSWIGNEASLREARCQIAMGQNDAAKTRLNALLQVPSHQAAAQAELNNLNNAVAQSAKPGGGSAGGMAAGKAAPARKSAAPARPSPAPRENADSLKKDQGF